MSGRTLRFLAVAGVALAAGSSALGQCGSWDNRFGLPPDLRSSSGTDLYGDGRTVTTWDPDGEGPQPAQLVVSGGFDNAGGTPAQVIARWDGSSWQAFGPGLGTSVVYALTSWDPDGSGPLAPQVVAGGDFTNVLGNPLNRIARFNGTSWQGFLTGMNGEVRAVTTWDPDGAGPLPAQLVAAGAFTTAGGVTVNRIARWDGAAWQPFGTGMNGTVYALTTWDPDGDGPQAAQLVAGGDFLFAGGVAAIRIASWNGTTWQALGSGANNSVRALTSWDPDDDGPMTPRVVAGGLFTTAGGSAANRIAQWDGSAWASFGSGMNDTVHALATWDPDGGGPQASQVIAGGQFTTAGASAANRIARWDGAAWQAVGSGTSGTVFSIATWDPDGPGAELAQPVAAGSYQEAGGVKATGLARTDGSTWRTIGPVTNSSEWAMTLWDMDGAGPGFATPVVAGRFRTAGGKAANGVAYWDGANWQPLGNGLLGGVTDGDIKAIAAWDPDGAGPQAEQLFAGRYYYISPANIPMHEVLQWDGSAWVTIGVMNSDIYALFSWDPDGSGPQNSLLVAGGNFTTIGGQPYSYIASWNGSSWQSFAGPLDDAVLTLSTWDPDGSGPQVPQLVAGGEFLTAGAAVLMHVGRWDGSAWQGFGMGVDSLVWSLTTWDPDGSGPLPRQLVAGGTFSNADGLPAKGVARWDGTTWQAFPSPPNQFVFAVTSWDPDGGGPQAEQLVIGGTFTSLGATPAVRIARWNGSAWQAFGSGIGGVNDRVRTLITWDPDGSGPQWSQLIAAGQFPVAGGRPAASVAMWATLAPEFTVQPQDALITAGADVLLTVAARNGDLTYQWRKDGVPLANGPTGSGSIISGATTTMLGIENAQPSDAGDYDAVVTNNCGSTTSEIASLTTPPVSCPGDANGDNSVDGADLSVMLGQFGQSVTPGTGGDLNGDGVVNGADLSVLLANFGSAC